MTTVIKNASNPQSNNVIEESILGITGLALTTSVVLISAYSPLLATTATNTPIMHGITHGTMFIFMAVMYFALSRFVSKRDAFVRSKLSQTVFFILQATLPVAVLMECMLEANLPSVLLLAIWAVFGIANAFFFCAWIEAQSSFGEEHIRSANLWSFGMAGCIAIAILAMPAITGIGAIFLISAASFILLLLTPPYTIDIIDERDERWFSNNSSFSRNGSYVMAVDGMMIGVIAGLLVARISKNVLPPATMGLIFVLVAITFFLINKKEPSFLELGRSQLVFLPILVCSLILSGFLDAPWNTVAAIPLFIILHLFDYTNSSVLALRGSILSVSPCYCFAKGRFFIILGQGIGWLVGAFIASDIGHGSLSIVSIFMVVLICTYIAAATIRPDKYPRVNEAPLDQQVTLSEIAPPPTQSQLSFSLTSANVLRRPSLLT